MTRSRGKVFRTRFSRFGLGHGSFTTTSPALVKPTTTMRCPSFWSFSFPFNRSNETESATGMPAAMQSSTSRRPSNRVAQAVYDPAYRGTGNWVFNMAYAGSFDGMRACATRFDGLREVEDCIAAGIPVALSVSFDLLNGKEKD